MKRRDAASHLQKSFSVTQRRACKVTGQPRSTQRLTPPEANKDNALIRRTDELVRENPRFAYRRTGSMLCQEGWKVNIKRVYRLWHGNGCRIEAHKNKKALSGSGFNACNRRRASFRNDIRAYDFIFDRLENGRPLKILALTDEYMRESLALEVGSSIPGSRVMEILNELVLARGLPSGIRSDNGHEFTGKAVGNWLKATGVEGLRVEKASPWQNGYAESYNSRFRDECLNMNQFFTLRGARILIGEWQTNIMKFVLMELCPVCHPQNLQEDAKKLWPDRGHPPTSCLWAHSRMIPVRHFRQSARNTLAE